MEYALKAASFNCGDGNANANWTDFATNIDKCLLSLNELNLKRSVQYILNNPPKKQIIKNGLIQWSSATPSYHNQTDLLLLYVRRVRNNLFHGGKFNNNWFDYERSEELLLCSIIVLEAALNINLKVKSAYDG